MKPCAYEAVRRRFVPGPVFGFYHTRTGTIMYQDSRVSKGLKNRGALLMTLESDLLPRVRKGDRCQGVTLEAHLI